MHFPQSQQETSFASFSHPQLHVVTSGHGDILLNPWIDQEHSSLRNAGLRIHRIAQRKSIVPKQYPRIWELVRIKGWFFLYFEGIRIIANVKDEMKSSIYKLFFHRLRGKFYLTTASSSPFGKS